MSITNLIIVVLTVWSIGAVLAANFFWRGTAEEERGRVWILITSIVSLITAPVFVLWVVTAWLSLFYTSLILLIEGMLKTAEALILPRRLKELLRLQSWIEVFAYVRKTGVGVTRKGFVDLILPEPFHDGS